MCLFVSSNYILVWVLSTVMFLKSTFRIAVIFSLVSTVICRYLITDNSLQPWGGGGNQ